MNGNDVRALLRRLGHSQVSAADALGVHRMTVVRWLGLGDEDLPERAVWLLESLRPRDEDDTDDRHAMETLLPLVRLLLLEDAA